MEQISYCNVHELGPKKDLWVFTLLQYLIIEYLNGYLATFPSVSGSLISGVFVKILL